MARDAEDTSSSAVEIREALRRVYPGVERGEGSVVTLLGAAETGKSRLVADIARDARERGWRVLMTTGSPRSGELPRGIVLDALRPLLPRVSSAQGVHPGDARSSARAPGLPLALAAFLPPGSAPGEEEELSPAASPSNWELPTTLAPAEADALLMRRLWDEAGHVPVLLLLDDAQWMDELSQRFLSSLCLALGDRRVLLVLSLDPEAAPPLVRRFAVREHGGLSSRVYRVAPAPTHHPRPLPPMAPPAPEVVEASLLETLLSTGAVVGIEFDVRTLAEITGRSPQEVQANLEEAARRGWLWKSGEESFHFAGERTWTWALSMPYQPLETRHQWVALALEKLYPNPEGRVLFELAHHWTEAGSLPRALPYLLRSAEAAFGVGAYEPARDRLERSRGMLLALPEPERGPQEVRVLVDLAQVLDVLGEGTKASAHLREALVRAERLHLPARETARIEVLLGDLQRRWGRGEHALQVLERARARAASAGDRPTEAMVLSRISMVQRRQGHWAKARESVLRSLELLSQGPGDAEARARVHFAAADVYIWGGKEDDAAGRQEIQLSRDAFRELGQTGQEVQLTNLEGLHASQLGDPAEALRLWRHAAETAVRMGNLVEAANMHGNMAEVLAEQRKFPEARSSIQLADELIEGMEEPRVRGQILLASATLAWRQGDLEGARRELQKGLKLLQADASVDLRQQLEFLEARMFLEEGRPDEARKITRELDPLRYPVLLPPVQKREWERIQEEKGHGKNMDPPPSKRS